MTDHNREEREALIEKAARAIKPRFDDYCVDADAEDHAWEAAEAAFAVFEQAHTPTRTVIQITPEAVQREYELRNGVTPTDDERIVRASIHGDVDAIRAFNRLLRRTAQSEPPDDEVQVFMKTFWEYAPPPGAEARVRAALKAAAAVREEGQGR